MVRFQSLELSTLAKWSPKKSRNHPGVVSPKNVIIKGNLDFFRIPRGRGFPHFSWGSRTNGWAPHVFPRFPFFCRGSCTNDWGPNGGRAISPLPSKHCGFLALLVSCTEGFLHLGSAWFQFVNGAQPFVCGIHSISAMDWKSATPRTPIFFFDNSLKNRVFWAEHPQIFSGIFRRSFCEGRELRRPKSDHVHPGCSCCFSQNDPKMIPKWS